MVKPSQQTTGAQLPSIMDIPHKHCLWGGGGVRGIIKDIPQPNHGRFNLLPPRKHYRSLCCCTNWLKQLLRLSYPSADLLTILLPPAPPLLFTPGLTTVYTVLHILLLASYIQLYYSIFGSHSCHWIHVHMYTIPFAPMFNCTVLCCITLIHALGLMLLISCHFFCLSLCTLLPSYLICLFLAPHHSICYYARCTSG